MTLSMTAFSRKELKAPWGSLSWELRSVNHRYLEISPRLPETLRDLVQSGNVPLAEALPAFTSNVAALLRLHGKGRLEKGRDADLVVLDEALEVRDVMARGQWHIQGGEPQVWGTYERD